MAEGKICVACGKDCSDTERVRDKQGRYICGACLSKRKAKAARGTPEKSSKGGSMMAALLEGIPDPTSPDNLCPGCGKLLKPEQAICLACGYNLTTGKALRTKVVSPVKPKVAKRRGG